MTTWSVTKVESLRGLVVLLLWVFVVFPRWLETTGQTLEGRDFETPEGQDVQVSPFSHWPLLMDSPSVLFMGSSTAPSRCLWHTGISAKHGA